MGLGHSQAVKQDASGVAIDAAARHSQYSLENKRASIGSIADQSSRVEQVNEDLNKFYSGSIAEGSNENANKIIKPDKYRKGNNDFEMITPPENHKYR